MLAATAVLVVAGLAASVVPGLRERSEQSAARFVDRGTYVAHLLQQRSGEQLPPVATAIPGPP